jgi:ppGpp synthetase/RelA/SpoT-type nucleotidyltranferase
VGSLAVACITDTDPQELADPARLSVDEAVEPGAFDFDAHRQQAVDAYQPLVPGYADFSRAVYSIIRTCLSREGIKVNSTEYRAKDPESFGRKVEEADDDNPSRPKYPSPLEDITDLAGVRVITFFRNTLEVVEPIIYGEFDVIEKTDKSAMLEQEERLGYHSVHYLVQLKDSRLTLPEYEQFRGMVAEVQVRTVLQHAWAEIEHDIQYKAVSALPSEIRRRFMSLAGMLEIADREFQALDDEDSRLRREARASVAAGRLADVEITPDALKSYLDQRFGPDGRMTDFSYSWEARVLRRLGFRNLKQLDNAVSGYNHDSISRGLHGTRQGQLSRLDDVLLAAMGEEFVQRHPWSAGDFADYWKAYRRRDLERLAENGVTLGDYVPGADTAA